MLIRIMYIMANLSKRVNKKGLSLYHRNVAITKLIIISKCTDETKSMILFAAFDGI